ncbi:putative aldehyde dehydrogenase-like protein [Podosphaera aphanis]|nr:putative aldehyde dehydrogenase-like protein [Podosphaera aphanis]
MIQWEDERISLHWTKNHETWVIWMTAVAGVVGTFLWLYCREAVHSWRGSAKVITYEITVPAQPADSHILESPSIKAEASTAIQCYAPATGAFLGYVNPQSREGIDRAIARAHEAQIQWAQTSFAQRRQVLKCIQAYILKNQEQICRVACLDSGKTMIDATLGEILVTVEKLRWTCLHGEAALRPSRRPTNLLMAYKKNYVRYEPLGVVAALVSWNYPFHNLIGPVISAIFSGNGIIVKASENTAWSATYFSQIVKEALHVCGHNPHLVQTVVTWPHTANHITSHPGISHITFIGSRPVAKLVAASAAKSLIPLVAELGGKDAAIILDSAEKDLARITEIILRGSFQAAGQNCIGIERVIACPRVYDKLVSHLKPRIEAIKVGSILDAEKESRVDMGAMISDLHFDRLEKLIASAVNDGARLLVGGHRFNHPVHHHGHYFEPTLLVDVTSDMGIANEECFGPICLLMRARDAKEACSLANEPNFGLGASVFGVHDAAMEEIIQNIKSGMVAVNDFAAYYAVQLPFGGVGGSGYGRFAGEEGLRGLCNTKAVCQDRWDWFGIRTAIPKQIRYPILKTDKGYEFTRAIVHLGYGMSLGERIQSLWRMWKNS